MPLLPKIERRMVVIETGEGFVATYKWIHDTGLLYELGVPIIEDVNAILIPDIDDGLIDDFPTVIPAGTNLWRSVAGAPPELWPCPQDAYLKSVTLTEAQGHEGPPVKAIVKGENALYSYTEEPTSEDPFRNGASNPWTHPISGKEYQATGGWPDIEGNYPAYYRWIGVAQHYLAFEVNPPYHWFLVADNAAAMDLISYPYGGGCYVSDWSQWLTIEGREPLVSFTNALSGAGISWRQTTQSGTRYIEVFVCVFPEDGEEEPGFFLPRNGVRTKGLIMPGIFGAFGLSFGFGLKLEEEVPK